MNTLELTIEEQDELRKKGFLVKSNFSIFDFTITIISILIYISVLSLIYAFLLSLPVFLWRISLYESINFNLIFQILWLIGLIPIVGFFITFLFSWKTFLSWNSVIEFWKIWPSKWKYFLYMFNSIRQRLYKSDKGRVIMIVGPFFGISFFYVYNILMDGVITPVLLWLTGILGWLFLIRYIFQYFHPLYAFGNLWEKIQKLTPQISTTSISIQDNFQKGMNYSILSDGFDSLSSTFSQIVSLVIGLEKIESRANKGNLFDSEKYINSLRTDITEPLISLRIFLEKQRDELIQSQKELSRVRVGWSDESTSIELASKRWEPLIQELTENIEKLSEMIGKIG